VSCAVTHAARTAFDLARSVPSLVEKVVAVDVLAYTCNFALDDLVRLRLTHPARGVRGTAPPRPPRPMIRGIGCSSS
jgi:hypothetical protein